MKVSKEMKDTQSTVDPGILEMGASVSVNDELRRTINAETADIENMCTKLVSDIALEEERDKEMHKSKHYTDKEQSGLIQCTNEIVETNQMNDHIFHGLHSRVEKEILSTSTPQGKGITTDGTSIVTPTEVTVHSSTSVFAIQQINNENDATVAAIGTKLGKIVPQIRKLKLESNEMVVSKKQIHEKVKSERLKVVLANAKHKVQLVEDLLKDAEIHHRTTKFNCDQIDAQNATLQEKSDAKVSFRFITNLSSFDQV
jgi:hypothetical protein